MWDGKDLLSQQPVKQFHIITPDYTEDLGPEFEELLGIFWTVYKVAPTVQIDYSKTYLKKCEKYVREKLTFLKESGDENIKVTLIELKDLVVSKYDKAGFKVIVEYDGNEKYRGIFLSLGTKKLHNGVYLPLLLVHGEKKRSIIITKILGELFNCQITQYDMIEDYMWWMFSVIVQTERGSSEKQMELEFVLPAIDKNNEDGSLSLYISCKYATTAWEKHCKRMNKIDEMNMNDFRGEIYKHAEDVFGVLISKLIFERIRHKTIFIYGNKFKTTSISVLCNIVIFLCQNVCLTT